MIDGYDCSPIRYSGSVVAKSFEQWKQIIFQKDALFDYIIVANYRNLSVNGTITYKDPKIVMAWTEKHCAVPVIGINSFNVEDGAMISIGVSSFKQEFCDWGMSLCWLKVTVAFLILESQTTGHYCGKTTVSVASL